MWIGNFNGDKDRECFMYFNDIGLFYYYNNTIIHINHRVHKIFPWFIWLHQCITPRGTCNSNQEPNQHSLHNCIDSLYAVMFGGSICKRTSESEASYYRPLYKRVLCHQCIHNFIVVKFLYRSIRDILNVNTPPPQKKRKEKKKEKKKKWLRKT